MQEQVKSSLVLHNSGLGQGMEVDFCLWFSGFREESDRAARQVPSIRE